jgi:hypothetical protein
MGNLGAAAGTGKQQSVSAELLDGVRVGRRTATLIEDRAVPLETEGVEGAEDGVRGSRHLALPVQILDSHQPDAAVTARVQVAAQGGHHGAEMEGTGGRGGEAPPVGREVLRQCHARGRLSGKLGGD